MGMRRSNRFLVLAFGAFATFAHSSGNAHAGLIAQWRAAKQQRANLAGALKEISPAQGGHLRNLDRLSNHDLVEFVQEHEKLIAGMTTLPPKARLAVLDKAERVEKELAAEAERAAFTDRGGRFFSRSARSFATLARVVARYAATRARAQAAESVRLLLAAAEVNARGVSLGYPESGMEASLREATAIAREFRVPMDYARVDHLQELSAAVTSGARTRGAGAASPAVLNYANSALEHIGRLTEDVQLGALYHGLTLDRAFAQLPRETQASIVGATQRLARAARRELERPQRRDIADSFARAGSTFAALADVSVEHDGTAARRYATEGTEAFLRAARIVAGAGQGLPAVRERINQASALADRHQVTIPRQAIADVESLSKVSASVSIRTE
jgi:hypothetical protein